MAGGFIPGHLHPEGGGGLLRAGGGGACGCTWRSIPAWAGWGWRRRMRWISCGRSAAWRMWRSPESARTCRWRMRMKAYTGEQLERFEMLIAGAARRGNRRPCDSFPEQRRRAEIPRPRRHARARGAHALRQLAAPGMPGRAAARAHVEDAASRSSARWRRATASATGAPSTRPGPCAWPRSPWAMRMATSGIFPAGRRRSSSRAALPGAGPGHDGPDNGGCDAGAGGGRGRRGGLDRQIRPGGNPGRGTRGKIRHHRLGDFHRASARRVERVYRGI